MGYSLKIAVLLAGATALSGCNATPMGFTKKPLVESRQMVGTESIAPMPGVRAEVNEGKMHMASITSENVPSLEDLKKIKPLGNDLEEDADEKDKLRRPAIRDTALAFGARGGLAHTSRQINLMLQARATKLDQVYDFTHVIIRGPDNVTVLPPVISEAKEAYEISDAGKTVRVADEVFEIISQAKFAPVKPLWHAYLVRDYSAPNNPPDEILPKTPGERRIWEKYLEEGWQAGVEQANEIFKLDMRRLTRDFDGMVRYKKLLNEGKVSPPVIAAAPLGVTGNGVGMRVNDRAIRITKDPELQLDASQWNATISNGEPSEYSIPNNSTVVREYPAPANRKY